MHCETYHATIDPEVCKSRQDKHTMFGGDPWCSSGRCEQGKDVMKGKHMAEKKCTQCGLSKPLSDYYKQSKSQDGHRSECKECTLKKQSDRDKERPLSPREERQKLAAKLAVEKLHQKEAEQPKAKPVPATKACSRCGVVKPLSEFHKAEDRPDGHRGQCKRCRNLAVNKGCRASLGRGRLVIDFTGREEMLAFITQTAEREFRTPENQVTFWINKEMERKDT